MRSEKPSTNQDYFKSLAGADKLKHLIKFAALAPSSHNSQPWLFKCHENSIEVFANVQRALKISDPVQRQMYLSIGAAITNILVAAEHFGYSAKVNYLFSGAAVCEILFAPAASSYPDAALVTAISSRHNNRFPFEAAEIDPEFTRWLRNQDGAVKVTVVSDPELRHAIAKTVATALEQALDDALFRKELSAWIKPSKADVEDGMPGYNLALPKVISFIFPWIVRNFRLGKIQRRIEAKSLAQTPIFVILSTVNDDQDSWLKTGMLFEKIALAAEKKNIRTGVLAAAIETPGYYLEVKKVLKLESRPQMFFRLGYCAKVPVPSPRLRPEKIIIAND